MKTLGTVLLGTAGAIAVAGMLGAQALTPESVQKLDWGKTPHVSHIGSIFFAGQVDEQGLERAKEAGVSVVLNLRDPSELNWDEQAAVEKLGMQYKNVPVTGSSFSPEAFSAIEQLVADFKDDGILIHCGSSNRVGGWLTTHLVKSHGMPLEEAIEIGKRAGMTSSSIEKRARAYVAENP